MHTGLPDWWSLFILHLQNIIHQLRGSQLNASSTSGWQCVVGGINKNSTWPSVGVLLCVLFFFSPPIKPIYLCVHVFIYIHYKIGKIGDIPHTHSHTHITYIYIYIIYIYMHCIFMWPLRHKLDHSKHLLTNTQCISQKNCWNQLLSHRSPWSLLPQAAGGPWKPWWDWNTPLVPGCQRSSVCFLPSKISRLEHQMFKDVTIQMRSVLLPPTIFMCSQIQSIRHSHP